MPRSCRKSCMNASTTSYEEGGLLGRLAGLVREASAAGGTARFRGGGEGHLVQVAIAHEADEDAAGLVVPGHARDHGYLHGGVRARGFGLAGLLTRLRMPVLLRMLALLRMLGLRGRGGADDRGSRDKRQLGLDGQVSPGGGAGIAWRLGLGSGLLGRLG